MQIDIVLCLGLLYHREPSVGGRRATTRSAHGDSDGAYVNFRPIPRRLAREFVQRVKPNPSRFHLEDFVRRAAASLASGSRMLDAGAGDSLYRHYFSHVIYESADFLKSPRVYAQMDYVCTLDDIPVEDDRFDLVLFTQVLEHVPDVPAVLKELHRVLRPEACIWLSAPLFFTEHETPYDFYRYTQYGLRHQLESAGFSVESIEWLEGYHGTLSYQLEMASRWIPLSPRHYGGGLLGITTAALMACARPLLFAMSLLLARIDMQAKYTLRGHPKNYAVVARKRLR